MARKSDSFKSFARDEEGENSFISFRLDPSNHPFSLYWPENHLSFIPQQPMERAPGDLGTPFGAYIESLINQASIAAHQHEIEHSGTLADSSLSPIRGTVDSISPEAHQKHAVAMAPVHQIHSPEPTVVGPSDVQPLSPEIHVASICPIRPPDSPALGSVDEQSPSPGIHVDPTYLIRPPEPPAIDPSEEKPHPPEVAIDPVGLPSLSELFVLGPSELVQKLEIATDPIGLPDSPGPQVVSPSEEALVVICPPEPLITAAPFSIDAVLPNLPGPVIPA